MKRALIVLGWIVAIAVMSLAWAGVPLTHLLAALPR
jgi:hypothetical protein